MISTYFKQETDYTCGPACMRMIFYSLGISKSEKQITKLLGTNKLRGTRHRDFVSFAEKYKLRYSVNRNATIDELRYYYKQHYKILVCYSHPIEKEGHYAVIRKITPKKITLMDPISGPSHTYSTSYFNKLWKSDMTFEGERSWFMAIKK
jgi:ABC-type bacteriocin/lantibiotic exporter with double-glycine peptidase domain